VAACGLAHFMAAYGGLRRRLWALLYNNINSSSRVIMGVGKGSHTDAVYR